MTAATPLVTGTDFITVSTKDIDAAVEQLVASYEQDFRRVLREENVPFVDITTLTVDSDVANGLRVLLPAGADLDKVRATLRKAQPTLACRDAVVASGAAVDCIMTPQQVRVLMMLSEGLLNKQIAYELGVSEATVKAHVSAILQKLGVESRTQAVIAASKIELGQWPQAVGVGH